MGKRNPAQVTLKDIAEITGYTINTVSHALKNRTDISAATRAQIQQAAETLGYVGNALAGSMRTGVTRTIALILGDIANPHFALIGREVEKTVRDGGYDTILYNTDEDPELERRAIRSALSKRVDGLILCPTQQNGQNLLYLRRCGVPFVLVGRRFDGDAVPGTVLDDETGGYLAARCLLRNGHRRIALLAGPDVISSAVLRRAGYERALREAGLVPDPALICPVGVSAGACGGAVGALLDAGTPFTGLCAFSDMLALEAIYALARRGLRVPEDVSVVGFDNIQAQFPVSVPLTTVRSAAGSMAVSAAEQLLLRMAGQPQTLRVLPVELVERQSVRSVQSTANAATP